MRMIGGKITGAEGGGGGGGDSPSKALHPLIFHATAI